MSINPRQMCWLNAGRVLKHKPLCNAKTSNSIQTDICIFESGVIFQAHDFSGLLSLFVSNVHLFFSF